MRSPSSDKRAPGPRLWRKGERAKVSILQVFRNSFEQGEAKRGAGTEDTGPRSVTVRDGMNEETLRKHLQTDLNALLNTIELGSATDLREYPHVNASIVNYGFRDLSNVAVAELNTPRIKESIRSSLNNHEPRLVRESIEIDVFEPEGNERQRLAISVSAELMGDPIDIQLDFDAEVDISAGTLKMSKLRMQT